MNEFLQPEDRQLETPQVTEHSQNSNYNPYKANP